MAISSRLFVGNVRHRRFTPVEHSLNYQLFMPAIDLDELTQLEKEVWGLALAGGIGRDLNAATM